MSKYDALWAYIRDGGEEQLTLSFGYEVGKISMKAQTVTFIRIEEK